MNVTKIIGTDVY